MATIVSLAPYKILPARIGGQKSIVRFYEYLSEYHRIICISTRNNDTGAVQGFELINSLPDNQGRYINPFLLANIRHIIRQRHASFLMIEHPYMGWQAVFLKWVCRVKMIVRSHNIEGLRFKSLGKWWWGILWQYEKWVHRQSDLNFFISEEDKQYAIRHFKLDAEKCITVTFGTSLQAPPSHTDKINAAAVLREKHTIAPGERILLFTGSFNYSPNSDALSHIENDIAPVLDQANFPYRILICGPWLENKKSQHPRIIYAGYVENIDLYFCGADVFINAVSEGGGIKTKLVEALAWNTNAVSTEDGAFGVDPAICNGKLVIIKGKKWASFAEAIMQANLSGNIPTEFYQQFYWGHNAARAGKLIGNSSSLFSVFNN